MLIQSLCFLDSWFKLTEEPQLDPSEWSSSPRRYSLASALSPLALLNYGKCLRIRIPGRCYDLSAWNGVGL